jgi:hypothetical protein
MITLGTESCGTNLLGGTVFFHRLANTFTFFLAKLSHLFGYGRSETVSTPLAVGGSVFTPFSTIAFVILVVLLALTVVVRIDVHIVVVTGVVIVLLLMVGRRSGQVARCSSCHFWINVDGITHGFDNVRVSSAVLVQMWIS